MKDPSSTHPELIEEISRLQQKIQELEQSESERKLAEKELRKADKMLHVILDTIPAMIWQKDLEGRYLQVNNAYCGTVGLPIETILGKTDYDLYPQEIADKYVSHDRKILSSGKSELGIEEYHRKPSGEYGWSVTDKLAYMDDKGNIEGTIGFAVDITKRKQAEKSLLESEKRFRLITETIDEAFWMADVEIGKIFYISPSFERIWGRSRESLYKNPRSFLDAIHVEDRERVLAELEIEKTGQPFDHEYRIVLPDGDIRYIWDRGFPVHDEKGQISIFTGVAMDITSRKLAKKTLKESEEKYRNIFENVIEGIFQTTPEGLFRIVNPVLARIYGYSSPEEMIETVTDIGRQIYVNPGERFEFLLILHKKGSITDFEVQLKRKDGNVFWASINARCVYDENGKILYHDGTSEDITSRKLAEEELQQTLEKLRKSLAGTIQVLSSTVETRDPYTAGHQRKVSNLARVIAQEMGLSNDTVDTISMAGIIHDIGKISVPAEILSKPGKLLDMEFALIKAHSQTGYDILKDVELPYPIAEIVLQHHERLDGSGYPQGLKGNQILLEARIISVADVVEAISSHRPYRPGLGIDVALEEIEKNKGILYDEKVVEVCIKLFRKKGFEFE